MNDPIPAPSRLRLWLARVGGLLWLVVLAISLRALHEEWSGFHFKDLDDALSRIGMGHLLLALAVTVLSHAGNAAMGVVAERWLGRPVKRPWHSFGVSFISAAFSLNAGGTVLGGGAIRMRFAASQGLTAGEAGRVTLFTAAAGWAGHAMLCGLLLMISPPPLDWLQGRTAFWLGAALVAGCMVLVMGKLVLYRRSSWPSPGLAALALLFSVLDWLGAGLALWVLLPDGLPVSILSFVAVIAISQAISAATHVPGGVGVLELTVSKMLSGIVPSATLAGALVTYRLLFYLLPLAAAVALLSWRELGQRGKLLSRGGHLVRRGWVSMAPRLATLLALGGGFMLLLSANIPMERSRLDPLAALLPLPFVEASHFLSSLAGALLIVLARGLQRRIHAAWWLTVILTVAAIGFSLAKGFDWEESIALCFLLACLLPFRSLYHRHSAIWSHRFSMEWWALLAGLLLVATWLGFFSTRHVEYSNQLWWDFAFDDDASRFLRALVGAAGVFVVVGLAQWLRPTKPRRHEAAPEPAEIEAAVGHSALCSANLAFLGDKQFEWSTDRRSFIMYAEQGRSRIALGDPVGDSEDVDDLLWRFIERAVDEGFRPVFYQVSAPAVPRFVDMGCKLFKLGEEAWVNLTNFSLEGPTHRKLRTSRNKFQREGYSFAMWDPAMVAERLPLLQAVSDAWLARHRTAEKGFSLGRFSGEYVRRFSCAVVMDSAGGITAFTNLWQTNAKEELSVDLMRHSDDAPSGVMDYLFTEIMLWGKAGGYAEFSLGMAPLSGLSTRALAPLWNKAAGILFHRGQKLYNFSGLRDYKEKFQPHWEPRYLAVQNAWSLPSALLDATTLIGGGLRGTLRKSA